MFRRLGLRIAVGGTVIASYIAYKSVSSRRSPIQGLTRSPIPSRSEMIENLKRKEFDVLIIGGGATGCGAALDAVSRGFSVALVEREDFSAGTSSRSTKLVHGGVRYLEKAFKELDVEQLKLVREALAERETVLEIAPHLTREMPIMVPIYRLVFIPFTLQLTPARWWEVPYMWIGFKVYDAIAAIASTGAGVSSSYTIGREHAVKRFPAVNPKLLKAAIVYFDGSMDDSGLNISLALTSAQFGATVANHVEVVGFLKEEGGLIKGATVVEKESGEVIQVRAKVVINATGPFSDAVLKLDNPSVAERVVPSIGTHIILPEYFCPSQLGLLSPSSDGRVIFCLPWMGRTLADSESFVTAHPVPLDEDIEFILKELRRSFADTVRREDVLAVWCGLRPLIKDTSATSTASLVRNHTVFTADSGLISIAGGKWTTYRCMAVEVMDAAVATNKISPKYPSQTHNLKLIGAEKFSDNLFVKLIQHHGVEEDIARHLANRYGDQAEQVLSAGSKMRLHKDYPYIEAEVHYAVHEYAVTAVDVIARRLRLAFLDYKASVEVLPRIVSILKEEHKWDAKRTTAEQADAMIFLDTMNPATKSASPSTSASK